MEYSSLYDLIRALSYGTKLHICLIPVAMPDSGQTRLPFPHTIHPCPVCTRAKNQPNGFARCFQCRNAAIARAADSANPFAGFCINGVYEYCHPVMENGRLLCVICIGNIYRDNPRFPAGWEDLRETMEPDVSYEQCHTMGAVLESYLRLLWNAYPAAEASSVHPLKPIMREFIEENFTCDLQLKTLAQLLHYHEKYLGRLFRQEFGMSFHRYLISRRLEQAERLLCRSNQTVSWIAQQTGFNSVSFFIREFRKTYGMTPTQYRNLSAKQTPLL